MAKVLIYDTECNSLDTQKGFIMEIAYALFDIRFDIMANKWKWRSVFAQSSLLQWDKYQYEVEPGAFAATGLTKEFCDTNGVFATSALDKFIDCVDQADFVGGHNTKNYDDKMIISNLNRLEFQTDIFSKKQKIDSMSDIDYPESIQTRKLGYLAYEHGYILSGAHEALNDVFASAHLFSCYDFDKIIENARQPIERRYLRLVFGDPRVQTLKEHRFYWEPKEKIWYKDVRANKVEELHKSLGFATDLFVQHQELPNAN